MSTAAQRKHLAQFVRRPAAVSDAAQAEQAKRVAKLDAYLALMTKDGGK